MSPIILTAPLIHLVSKFWSIAGHSPFDKSCSNYCITISFTLSNSGGSYYSSTYFSNWL